ncbi:MAG: PEP-CTERM sorting domain-containing protein [Halofilum sp. (in: g-proteobacteria)]|nr:PEP-CTERM sorting domain-containing protein [Halofilum sp. (in: g-proteobacteria)]
MKKAWILSVALFGSLVMAPAHAALTMTIIDDDGVVLGPFVESSPNFISVSGTFGLFTLSTHTTTSNVGTGDLAGLFTLNSNVSADGAGSISVSVTQDAYTIPAAGLSKFTTGSNPVTLDGGATYSVQTFVDGVALGSGGTLASVTDDYFESAEMAIGNPFSITHTYTITTTRRSENITFDYSTRAVPVPGVLGLLGLGLVGVAAAVRRRRDQTAA